MSTPSELARRIAGTYIEDDATPKTPLLDWIQAECRHGCFRKTIEECAKEHLEPLRTDLVTVESVDPNKITLKIPCRVADRESTSPFAADVTFELDPKTLRIVRV
jgi:hypothetical protein